MQYGTLVLYIVAVLFAILLGGDIGGASADSGIMIIAFILTVLTAIAGGSQVGGTQRTA